MTLSTTPRMVHIRTQLEGLQKLASEPNIFVKPSKCAMCSVELTIDELDVCIDCHKIDDEWVRDE